MDLTLLFTNTEDANSFTEQWNAKGQGAAPWKSIITQAFPPHARQSCWKKVDGVAQVIQKFPGDYDFALMMDAEIGIHSCSGFKNLYTRLQAKHDKKTWYGDSHDKKPSIGAHVNDAACVWGAGAGCSTDPEATSLLQAETKNYKLYSWWLDMPYVHIETARRMYDKLGTLLPTHNNTTPTPMYVSSQFGEDSHPQIQRAGGAFEHMIYQFYTVAHEGFHIVDLVDHISCGKCAYPRGMGENFWNLDKSTQDYYLQTVEPLWLPGKHTGVSTAGGPVLMQYHLDRKQLH